ncbi:unnamed protein product [Amoebophrya sp. A25]|nr:unnamed protein product [Amoebophrya sp. A25]|eukprot:GSA25T00021714001.1
MASRISPVSPREEVKVTGGGYRPEGMPDMVIGQENDPVDYAIKPDKVPGAVFADIKQMEKVDVAEELQKMEGFADLLGDGDDGGDYFKSETESYSALIARAQSFEFFTLAIIVFNGLWMGYDTDNNVTSEGKAVETLGDANLDFVIMENFFALYFTCEVLIRFVAFEKKGNCLNDFWFKFDSFLVGCMVLETWVMPLITGPGGGGSGSGTGSLSILRLLRLIRLTRLVRLMRSVPELLTLLKGISTATKAVGSTLLLLFMALYVFAIIFRQNIGSANPDFFDDFGSIWKAAYTLFSAGTVIDNIAPLLYRMKEGGTAVDLVMFFLYILISSFTILNMLIGVLVEVVSSVSVGEKEKAVITGVADQLSSVFRDIDVDGSGYISRYEFNEMLSDTVVKENLIEIGIQPKHLALLADALFEVESEETADAEGEEGADQGKEISFVEFLRFVLHTRPQNPASVLDISQLRRHFTRTMESSLRYMDMKCENANTRKEMIGRRIVRLKQETENMEESADRRRQEISQLKDKIDAMRMELENKGAGHVLEMRKKRFGM